MNSGEAKDSSKPHDAHPLHSALENAPSKPMLEEGFAVQGIQKIKNKNGSISYRAQIRLKDGLPSQSKSFPTRQEAARWKAQEETKRREGLYFPSSSSRHKTLAELIDRYVVEVLPHKPRNARNIHNHLKWWKEQLGSQRLSLLTPDVISRHRLILQEKLTPKGTRLSVMTLNRYLSSLSGALSYAVNECGWLHSNPVFKVSKFGEPTSRNRILTQEETQRLLAACRASKCRTLYPFVYLALTTGCRYGELAALKWVDVDLGRETLFLRDTKNGKPRSVPLCDDAIELLKSLRSTPQALSLLVFCGRTANTQVHLRKPFATALAKAQIEGLRMHDLRTTFVQLQRKMALQFCKSRRSQGI